MLEDSSTSEHELTRLLTAVSDGDREAFEKLIPLVYDDLRAIAHRRMQGEREGHTLSTTAVVHEAYVRLVNNHPDRGWQGRVHFFAVASKVMRHVLIDYARRARAEKRGGDRVPVTLSPNDAARDPRPLDVLELDRALTELAALDPRLEQIVDYRFFGGMTMEEAAEAMGVSVRTAHRDWQRARAYLYEALEG